MSLNFELGKIKDWQTVTRIAATADDPHGQYKKGDMIRNPVTTSLIFATMGIGIGTITEDNWREVYTRIQFWEAIHGPLYATDDAPQKSHLTPEFIKAHIGLWTNVFPKETTPKWLKRVFTNFESDIRWKMRAAEEAAEKEPA